MKDKLGQQPAFPTNQSFDFQTDFNGVSKRLYIATMAMQGLINGCVVNNGNYDAKWTAKAAFNMADELLRQENE